MEKIETLNRRLEDFYGKFEDGRPNFRLVWSDEQYETRFGDFEKVSPGGLYLGVETGYRTVPKYPYMAFQWVLERLCPVPPVNFTELTTKTSYEPIWGFNNLPGRTTPNWEPIKLLIDTLIENLTKSRAAKQSAEYKERGDTLDTKEAIEARVERYKDLLFGGESNDISTALHHKEAVVIPNKQFGETI